MNGKGGQLIAGNLLPCLRSVLFPRRWPRGRSDCSAGSGIDNSKKQRPFAAFHARREFTI